MSPRSVSAGLRPRRGPAIVLALIAAYAVLWPLLASSGMRESNYDTARTAPGWPHVMGTDTLGFDVSVQVAEALRVSLVVALGAALVATVLGLAVGTAAASLGGRADRLLMRVTDAVASVPHGWLAALPGQCLCSLHLWVLPTQSFGSGSLVRHVLHEDTLIASTVADGHGEVYTDFALHADGYSRMVLLAGGMTPRRLGRLVQRLLEVETYRMAALLGLPAAREAAAELGSGERELAALADAIRTASRHAEPELLDRLTRLAGQVESQYAATHSRFSASKAYFELVDLRIAELHESRLAGMQTIREFMDRRLSPARSTCEWAARRQEALSQRVSRMSNLLRTRVEIEQQQSSQQLLATMNQRQGLQLQLQSAVEGLSVAAITYYIVGLVSYLAKGAQPLGWPLSPETTAAAAIPVVALAVWWSIQRMHQRMLQH